MEPKSRKLSRKALRDDIYDVILDWLMTGVYQPDQPLTIDQIARELGVSPTPVREAMVELEHTGLVTRAALRGYRVAKPLSKEQIVQLMDVRILLETAAAERAFARRAEFLDQLRAAHAEHVRMGEELARMEAGGIDFDPETLRAYFKADWAFHEIIFQYCGNPYITKSVGDLAFSVHRMRQTMLAGSSDQSAALAEHAQILQAFEGDDIDLASQAVRQHLSQVIVRAKESA